MTIDERLEALTTTVEILHHMTKDLLEASTKDAENIRALANLARIHEDSIGGLLRIAETHGQRLTDLEGGAR